MNGSRPLAARCKALIARAAILREIRRFFTEEGYLEVETPLRIPSLAPEAHIDAIQSDGWLLQTSPEICMKRMLAAGYERLFQICHCWRADERGKKHLPEFTMLEWYRVGVDYRQMMTDCENLVRGLAASLGLADTICYQKTSIELTGEWERLTVREAFTRYGGLSMEEALAREMFDEIMVRDIEPLLGLEKPTFICDYPAERSALARLKPEDPSVAERFELYIGGVELANAFSELTNPVEQRRRFVAEAACREKQRRPAYPLPEPFLNELSAMPPSAGIALGVDRLVMVLIDALCIDEVVAFTPEEL